MEKQYKTFEDLEFKPHEFCGLSPVFDDAQEAWMEFENGYRIHVVLGSAFYSNGRDNYEVATIRPYINAYRKPDEDIMNVEGGLTADEVTQYMKQIQQYR